MRVLQVCLDGNLPRYGIGLAVVRLSEHLAAQGHEVTLACRAANAVGLTIPGVEVLGLEHRRSLLGSARGYLAQLAPVLARPQDVVHVHGVTRAAHWLLPARRRRGAPLVVTAHSPYELGPTGSAANQAPERRARRHRRQMHAVLARADVIVVPSRYGRGLVEAEGASPSRVRVLPLGPTDDAPVARRAHAGFVVLALMRFVATKGADVLVDAFARAFPSDADAVLVMGGEGPTRDATIERARGHGLGERARFPQWLEGDARRTAFEEADVVVVPSTEGEMFCLTALDAQAAGVALIVSSQGALPERAADGAAVVVPRADVDALAAALRRVRDDAVFRETIAERGARSAASYRWPDVARAHRAVYQASCA